MKLICLYLASTLIAFSCTRKAEDFGKKESVDINIEAIVQIEEEQEIWKQKEAFRLLNKYEKAEIWRRRFEKFKETNKSNLSNDQLIFINRIISTTNANLYATEVAPAEKVLHEQNLNQIAIEAKQLFGFINGRALVATLNNLNSISLPNNGAVVGTVSADNDGEGNFEEPNNGDGLTANCRCSRASDWCFLSTCQNTYCNQQSSGCGTQWAYGCNGECR